MFDKVVFAGGGHRCWWQAGFWEQLSGEIELHPRVIGGVSAGAATACLLYANDGKRALAWYERELKGRRSNINWLNLVRRGERLMPHAAIYRKALRALLGGENFRQLMWRAPEIRVQYSRLPPGMGSNRALLSGMLAYSVEKYGRGSLHSTFGQRMGFTHEVKRVQDCRSERELVDLLVASSSTPPFTPVETIDGLPCLDGGLVDSVPIATVADVPGQTLVLTTRRYKAFAPVFARNGLLYVQPSEKVAASSWDYTSPHKYQKTYDLGRRDAEAFLKTFALGRFHDAGSAAQLAATGPEPVAVEGEVPASAARGGATTVSATPHSAAPNSAAPDSAAPDSAAPPSAVPASAAPAVAMKAGAVTDGPVTAGAVAAMPTAGDTVTGSAVEDGHPQMWATDESGAAARGGVGQGDEPITSLERFESAGSVDRAAARDDGALTAAGRALPLAALAAMPSQNPLGSVGTLDAQGGTRQNVAARSEDGGAARLDVNARLADYRGPGDHEAPVDHQRKVIYSDPTEAGIADDLSASQPAASEGQKRSGRSLRASKI